ncbi:MAG: hypothetical protein J4432_03125 [DPANN group archaeon]|nr:hypothetical protein [DPANN group archaeon]
MAGAKSKKTIDVSIPIRKETATIGLLSIMLILLMFNQVTINNLNTGLTTKSPGLANLQATGQATAPASGTLDLASVAERVIPKGVPEIYGPELDVTFDDPIKSLSIISALDPTLGANPIEMNEEQKERYIKILTVPTMTCEFCCGAKTAVFPNGDPACGCEHSYAIRGLTAYLIVNHPDMKDEQIMGEISRWKVLFFPKQMTQRYVQEAQAGKFTADIAFLMLANGDDPREIAAEFQTSGATSTLDGMPDMVGGC